MRILLRYRIIALTTLCLAPVVAASSYALVHVATRYFWKEAAADATAFANTVRHSTRHAMLTFNRDELEAILNAVSLQRGVESVRLYDEKGRFRLPRGRGAGDLDSRGKTCNPCHAGPDRLSLPTGGCMVRGGDVLELFYPIPNEPTCQSTLCHTAEGDLLGVLEVRLDTRHIGEQVGDLREKAILWGIAVLLASALPLFLVFGWAVGRPLTESVRLVREITRGNLWARSEVRRTDEWGELLAALDFMAQSLDRAKEDLEGLNRQLEAKVRQRTRDLESALIAAQESDRMKSEFLAGMSHELSTPLHAIIGYSELILDGIEGEITQDQRTDIEVVLRNGRILLGRVEDLLQLSRLEATRAVLCVDRIPLVEVAEEVVEAGRRLAVGRPVEITLRVGGEIPEVVGELRALRHVFFHLVENAIRHTEEGSVTVTVGHPRRGEVEVSVEDTGSGMSEEVVERALRGFSSKEGGGGLGLGLSLVRRLVELHHGRLEVSSKPGGGTTARVILPVGLPPEFVFGDDAPPSSA